ncbi:MAG: MBL fold metallo-hydrolase [Candidatus Woesearchaeota archaeon]
MQQPKIIFLGTAGDSMVVGKQLKASGGIIVQVEDSQFHIDPGPGALVKAAEYGINLRTNTAVLCSNNCINHCNDINAVISAMSLSGMDVHGVFVGNKTVINGSDIEMPFLTNYSRKCIERVISLEKGQRVGINNIEIKATATKHSDDSAIGFRMLTSNFNLGYTSDTGYTKELAEDFKGVDLLILNVAKPDNLRDDFQLCTHDAARLVDEIKPKLVIITHFGIKMLEADVLSQARFIQKETKIQTLVAKDGMVVNPISYAVNLRQKTLNLFQK